MQMSAVAALMIVTTILLSACEQQQVASVEDRGAQYYGRTGFASSGYSNATYDAVAVDSISTANLAAPSNSISFSANPEPAMGNSISFAATPAHATGMPFGYGTPAPGQQAAAAPSYQSAAPAVAPMASAWAWPVQGRVLSRFGNQGAGIANEGISIAATEGTPIRAAAAGEVAYVGSNVPSYGNLVILRHANGELTSYAHAREIVVSKGAQVGQGTVLAYVGQTGEVSEPQLHFAMRQGDQAVDPMSKLPSELASR